MYVCECIHAQLYTSIHTYTHPSKHPCARTSVPTLQPAAPPPPRHPPKPLSHNRRSPPVRLPFASCTSAPQPSLPCSFPPPTSTCSHRGRLGLPEGPTAPTITSTSIMGGPAASAVDGDGTIAPMSCPNAEEASACSMQCATNLQVPRTSCQSPRGPCIVCEGAFVEIQD